MPTVGEISRSWILETAHKFRKRKKNSSSCVYVLHKTSHQEISRPSRVVSVKKCTKKCNALAELFFWGYQACCFFDVLVVVAVAVAKAPYFLFESTGGL